MSIKKCVNGSFVNDFYKEYGTDTDTITSLPKTIIGDGQPISSYTIKGNMTQSGTPTPSNPVYPQETGDKTANLWNGEYEYCYVAASTGIFYSPDNTTISAIIPIDSNTTYSIEKQYKDGVGYGNRLTVAEFTEYPVNGATGNVLFAEAGAIRCTITTSNNVAYLVIFTLYTGAPSPINLMINKGSTILPYEPPNMYKIPILSNGNTYPIYLTEPLFKVGNYADTIDSNGVVTRNIAKLTFMGTETWLFGSVLANSNATDDGTANPSMLNQNVICTHFASPDDIYISSSGARLKIPLSSLPSGVTTPDEFKAWFATQYNNGTPVIMYYVRATPTTEQATVPTIPTTSGSPQSFDVDTTLKPSEVSLTYHGWHEHSDTKYTTP